MEGCSQGERGKAGDTSGRDRFGVSQAPAKWKDRTRMWGLYVQEVSRQLLLSGLLEDSVASRSPYPGSQLGASSLAHLLQSPGACKRAAGGNWGALLMGGGEGSPMSSWGAAALYLLTCTQHLHKASLIVCGWGLGFLKSAKKSTLSF